MSPVHSSITRWCSPSFSQDRRTRRRSAPPAPAATVSGVANFTSSTLWNWCWRISPRVSLPAAPASARKQGEKAQYFSGQLLALEDLVLVVVGDRHLGGGDEEALVVARGLEGVVLELRQLAGAGHRLAQFTR